MNSIERDELERKVFLDVDRFFLANTEAFRRALGTLKPMLGAAGSSLNDVLDLYEASVRCGDFSTKSILHTVPRVCFVLIWTVYSHLTAGTPLFINEELIAAWEIGDGTPSQCMACGLRLPVLPELLEKCPHCGGDIGLAGNWDRRQSGTVN